MAEFMDTGSDIKVLAKVGETALAVGQFYLLTDTLGYINGISRNGIAVFKGAATQLGDLLICRVVGGFQKCEKTTGEAWTAGQKLYWNDTTKKFTTTASTNKLIAIAEADALSADTLGNVFLK